MTAQSHGTTAPLPIAVVGLGGYGGTISRLLEEQSRVPNPRVRLVGVYEPDTATRGARLAELSAAGVATAPSYDALLAGPAEAVWLPVPIALHRPFTEQALAAGKAVMCEKPAAGSIDDWRAMCDARDRAGLPVAIGFQDLYDPATAAIKRHLLAGAIGQPQRATLVACWPRDHAYYTRNGWAGRTRIGDTWINDSPASNAISHYVNLALFWLGDDLPGTARPLAVTAELYRANPIENYDTCCLRLALDGGRELLVFLTHACARQVGPLITIAGTNGTLTSAPHQPIVLRDTSGAEVGRETFTDQRHAIMARQFAGWVRQDPQAVVYATLDQSEAHLIAINGAAEATAIHNIPPAEIISVISDGGSPIRAIRGIEALFAECARRGQLPSETDLAPWSSPAGHRDLRGYAHFAGPRDAVASEDA